ncbi:hypothetical protein A0H81_07836 [Grifola frondosa]|uniref:Uncharacterized protein n=1 Tax=Grifola frondosa TaxID=5627 RepID=A0A1C7MAN4_GRIFR|nr:hypothetical protein A0H81_07836 [Grifola frondosa]
MSAASFHGHMLQACASSNKSRESSRCDRPRSEAGWDDHLKDMSSHSQRKPKVELTIAEQDAALMQRLQDREGSLANAQFENGKLEEGYRRNVKANIFRCNYPIAELRICEMMLSQRIRILRIYIQCTLFVFWIALSIMPSTALSISRPMGFASLRLTQKQYVDWKEREPIDIPNRAGDIDTVFRVRVVGFKEDARAVIRGSNTEGGDFLEVPWCLYDNVLCSMGRLEEKLRIPIMYWRLAGDGMMLPPTTITHIHSFHSLFKEKHIADLRLVPMIALDEYLSQNEKIHGWRVLGYYNADSNCPRQQAHAVFNLIEPVESPSWPVYIQQRKAADYWNSRRSQNRASKHDLGEIGSDSSGRRCRPSSPIFRKRIRCLRRYDYILSPQKPA